MALLLETIPEKLTDWGERCVCHEQWHQQLSPYMLKKLLKKLFGRGWLHCPLNGLRAPELAAGELLEILERVWALAVAELM